MSNNKLFFILTLLVEVVFFQSINAQEQATEKKHYITISNDDIKITAEIFDTPYGKMFLDAMPESVSLSDRATHYVAFTADDTLPSQDAVLSPLEAGDIFYYPNGKHYGIAYEYSVHQYSIIKIGRIRRGYDKFVHMYGEEDFNLQKIE